jgi:peptidoglycan-N-acetylglucosamine deacetylase
MISLRHIIFKLNYLFWDNILPKEKCSIPDPLLSTRNIFIYFDYEREFGNYNAVISNNDINFILGLLEDQSIKSTWFTVGKVFEKYPDTINTISKNEHEVGSHTYAHIAPYETSTKTLNADFQKFYNNSHSLCKVSGFHSPRGRWSYKMFRSLFKFNFLYDVVGQNMKKPFKPYFLWFWPKRRILRLQTAGDDWPLYKNKPNVKEEALNYLIGLSNEINRGEIGGIGFHPWVLFADDNILKAFKDFLIYLNNQKDIKLETANYFNNLINKNLE